MREILFRGQRTDNKEWVEGIFETHPITKLTFIRTPNHIYFDVNMVIPETVGQFTGLYDATPWEELTTEEQIWFLYPENGGTRSKEDWKGRPIFEGDIVECFSSDYAGRPKIDTIIVKDMTDYNTMVYLNCSNNLKIIGNAHDNPDC